VPKLSTVLKKQGTTSAPVKSAKRDGPLWKGPCDNAPMGGITQSMIARWLQCRERFRINYIEGIRPTPVFSIPIEFGNMWHVCEEALAAHNPWEDKLKEYCIKIARKYLMQQDQVDHWYNVVKVQFPHYIEYWRTHQDVKERTPISQEEVFHVSYSLPSGRQVWLKGKYDSVDLIGKGRGAGVYLQENKTKSKIDEQKLKRQLTFDLQTMMYLISLTYNEVLPAPILGVRYNVIRRDCPIRRHQATQGSKCPKCKGVPGTMNCPKCEGVGRIGAKPEEEKSHFYNRLSEDYFKQEPDQWFMRWKSEVSAQDIQKFKDTCLDPILENICWWYEELTGQDPGMTQSFPGDRPTYPPSNWRHPFGIRNILDEGGSSDLDEYLATGSMIGLHRVDTLFEELQ